MKDHKQNFHTNRYFRLINPTKTNIGKSKKPYYQWKNLSLVIKWFKNIHRKINCSFIVFNIGSLNSSIPLSLFNNAIQFAKSVTYQIMIFQLSCTHVKLCYLKMTNHVLNKAYVKILMFHWAAMSEQKCAS